MYLFWLIIIEKTMLGFGFMKENQIKIQLSKSCGDHCISVVPVVSINGSGKLNPI